MRPTAFAEDKKKATKFEYSIRPYRNRSITFLPCLFLRLSACLFVRKKKTLHLPY